MREMVRPNRHITFIVAKKLKLQFILPYGICGGRGLVENFRIPSYNQEGLQLPKNPSYDI